MIRQYIWKRSKIIKGILITSLPKKFSPYKSESWWDKYYYTGGISDRQTIQRKKSDLTTRYHYNSVEMQILRYFYNKNLTIENSAVLDIGSGAGHWIDFYKSLYCSSVIGVDISSSSVKYLKKKYMRDKNIEIKHGSAVKVLKNLSEKFDIVNAIGVMFHIVDDAEWIQTIKMISQNISHEGVLVVGGHLGILNKLNVQIDKNGQVNKRLRSKRWWKSVLHEHGFNNITISKNNAYLSINDTLPEANILFARK
jgi:SAM-dependent methyltransferase